jgi:hypothetical protein
MSVTDLSNDGLRTETFDKLNVRVCVISGLRRVSDTFAHLGFGLDVS